MIFSRKNKTAGSPRETAKKLDGKAIKYVALRTAGGETVIGREGALIVRGGELLVFSSADVVFRCNIDGMTAGELLSLGGVIITAPDLEHGGEVRTVVAYYTKY